MKRYSCQTVFPKIRDEGQKKLLNSSVLIIGLGGVGSNTANSLVRAGIGSVKIVDKDYVELSNLHRQMLFDEKDVGAYKALAAYEKLRKINSSVDIEAKVISVDSATIEELIKDVDVVLDGTDNLKTRFVINDACVKNSKPWIYGAVLGSTGMSMNILPDGPCLRCFLKKIPPQSSLPTSNTIGIVNTVPSIIAAYQVTEAVKILLGDKDVCKDLIYVDVWSRSFDKIKIKKNKNCVCCAKKDFEFLTSKHI